MNGRHDDNKSAARKPQTFKEVQAKCVVSEDPDNYAIDMWVNVSKSLYKKAQIAEETGDLVEAYIFYSRTYDICINCMSTSLSALSQEH